MPVLPLGGLDHAHADAIFDTACRIERLQLGHYRGDGPICDVIEPHQRRASYQGANVLCDSTHVNSSLFRCLRSAARLDVDGAALYL